MEEIDISFGTIHIVLTTYCNQGCKGCYQTEKEILNKESDFKLEFHKDRIKSLFKYFQQGNKKIELSFFGGEPLLKTNTMKDILVWLKEENLIPDKIKIPTSGGKNLNLIDKSLEVIYLGYELFPNIEISLSLSYDGTINKITRNATSEQIKEAIIKYKKNQEILNKEFLSLETTNLIPQIIHKDYFIEQYLDILETTGKLGNFRIPHLLNKTSNLDSNFFRLEIRNFLEFLKNKPLKEYPKLFRDQIERIKNKNNTIKYTWCNAGINHFSLSNINNKEFTGCEFLDKPALILFDKMLKECNNCAIKYYCSKPCLKTMETEDHNDHLNQFSRQCNIRKIIFQEIKNHLLTLNK